MSGCDLTSAVASCTMFRNVHMLSASAKSRVLFVCVRPEKSSYLRNFHYDRKSVRLRASHLWESGTVALLEHAISHSLPAPGPDTHATRPPSAAEKSVTLICRPYTTTLRASLLHQRVLASLLS